MYVPVEHESSEGRRDGLQQRLQQRQVRVLVPLGLAQGMDRGRGGCGCGMRLVVGPEEGVQAADGGHLVPTIIQGC